MRPVVPLWSWILGWLFSAVAVIGNSLLVILIAKKRQLHTTTNAFILSLAVADLCVGLFLISFRYFCENWPGSYCSVLLHFRWFFIYASVCNLCAMTAERYAAIVKPLRYNEIMKTSRVALLITTAWTAPLLIRLIGFTVYFNVDKKAALRFYLPVVLILFEFLPCGVLLLVTTRMIVITRRISRQVAARLSQLRFNHAIPPGKSGDFSTVRVIAFVVAIFLVCFAASLFSSFCDIYRQSCSTPEFVWILRRLCLVANSAANPIAYAFLKRDIRREMKKTLRKSHDRSAPREDLERESQC